MQLLGVENVIEEIRFQFYVRRYVCLFMNTTPSVLFKELKCIYAQTF